MSFDIDSFWRSPATVLPDSFYFFEVIKNKKRRVSLRFLIQKILMAFPIYSIKSHHHKFVIDVAEKQYV
jgi:hypothetical protein